MSRLGRPDVRAGVVALVALGFGGAGFLGWEPDVRGLRNGQMSGLARPDVRAGEAGCLGPGSCSPSSSVVASMLPSRMV